jgi:transketolase
MKNNKKLDSLRTMAYTARRLIIETANKSKSAHVGSSLSCVDLLVSLYFDFLNIAEKDWQNRDFFILSKAHSAMALYSVLNLKGFLTKKKLMGYLQNDGTLPAHLDRFTNKAIEVSAGSLGHGFNIALGIAYGHKLKGDKQRVVTLIGDGESQEGSIWEGALFAPKLELDNFTAILDHNNLQGYGRPTEICNYEPIIDKWHAFGWQALRIDGHNFSEISEALNLPQEGKPKIIIADTIKGKGISFMENELKWHYFVVTDELKENAFKELEESIR